MDAVADDDPLASTVFADARRRKRLLVAAADGGVVVGFVLLRDLDGAMHIEQLAVAPEWGRQGIGRGLMSAAADLARDSGAATMTLTTFRDVPFNGPFYAALGWRVIPEHALSPGLARVRDDERAVGLDRWPRQAMWSNT
ncbi:GNAT family N-acetyltransferase [Tomitella fengzijianii]|uniref:GNAT family N-acetyltransferase n=2 Tax=Tomitella fengzijianii TaxID=2597660 RepID=A0A516X7U1_9ACTN|nr:GNAT family N-acetyltransferase [Tomitella fengzijianii]